ncbi:MAG: MBL fold metallo-hydrolase [Candidatus Aenigmarchaeota archaeon]|nr:MBL fold metallo-hydrolase [Candidatus Aenigmarchaeota archaeon]
MAKLTFLGAINDIGASGLMLEVGGGNIGKRFVFDYGSDVQEVPQRFPAAVKGSVDAAFLSHAHLDHCGGIALLSKRNSFPIYSQPITRPITDMLLEDSLKIARNDGIQLPFTHEDVHRALKHFAPMEYKQPVALGKAKNEKLTAVAYDAGHVPGSMMTFVDFGLERSEAERTKRFGNMMYTGDFNTDSTRLLSRADTALPEVDALVMESTYAKRDHPDREEEEKRLVRMVEATIDDGGIALIANFALGRTQEVMMILNRHGIDYPLYMDGMSRKATTIINSYPRLLRDPTEFDKALRKIRYINNEQDRKRAIKEPCAVLTTSGMLNGGPIVWYVRQMYDDPRCSLILTGFQVDGSAGRTLLDTGRFVSEDVRNKLNLRVRMEVSRMDFSSHCGRKQLFDFVEHVKPRRIFCVHGEDTPAFAAELKAKGFDAVAPTANSRAFDI